MTTTNADPRSRRTSIHRLLSARTMGVCTGALLAASCGGGTLALEPRYVALHNAFAAMGMVQTGSISQGSLGEGAEATIEQEMQPGTCYTIVGIGSSGVSDLDVLVLDEGGNAIARDSTQDGQAAAQFCPPYGGRFRISVHMTRGSGGYIVSAWQGGASSGGGYDPYAGGGGGGGEETGYVARPPHGGPGTCDEPWAIEVGNPARGDTSTGDSVTTGSCIAGGTAPEHVYSFQVTQRSLVTAVMSSSFDGALYFLGTCGEMRSELSCNDDSPNTSRSEIHATLDAGLYYLVVDGYGSSMGEYEVELTSSPMRSTGEICGGATLLTPGQPVAGTTSGQANYFEASCAGQARSPDRVYAIDVAQRSRMRVRMQSTYDGAIYVRSTCADPSSELACNDDHRDTRHSMLTTTVDPGRYYVYADGFSEGEVGDYSLLAELGPATGSGANGDLCASPGTLTSGQQVIADTFTAGDELTGSCGGQGSPDVVYRIDVTSRTRVRASFTEAEFAPVVYLQRTCGDATTEVTCVSAAAGMALDQTLTQGTYYLVVDGGEPGTFGTAEMSVTLDDLGALETACRSAPLIRPGTQITGDTTGSTDRFQATCAGGAQSPDMIYRLQVRRRSAVRISSEQTEWDGAIYIRRDCTDQSTEVACNDDAGDNRHSLIDTVLEPGTYFVFVDGFSSGNQGPFSLDVEVTAP